MEPPCRIRTFSESDSTAVLSIFNYYVENGDSAFPEAPVSLELISLIGQEAYGVFIAECNEGVAGFGLIRPFQPFPAFQAAGMVTYFVKPGNTRKGIGSLLLSAIEEFAKARAIKVLLAEISSKNTASLTFHQGRGFRECGRFHNVGVKFGTPFDLVWMEKLI